VRLDSDTLQLACRELAARDVALEALARRNGVPPLWRRDPGFPTMVKLILEQQVSLASGAAAYRRLEERIGAVTPARFLTLDDDELRSVGFSRQKTRYVRLLAAALADGTLDLDGVAAMDDDSAAATLTSMTGIGPWTAANYLLFGLGRPDVWPSGDRALVVSMQRAFDLTDVPSYDAADEMAATWRPWRSVAARLLWHDYLGGRAYDGSSFS
jgi:DNA-3-methyladenine glycosylase II